MVQNNSITMETKIIKQEDFALTHSSHHDSYFLFYLDHPILECDLEYLFARELIYQIFEFEPDPKKASGFIRELYNWGITQQEACEKILNELMPTEILMILKTGRLGDIQPSKGYTRKNQHNSVYIKK